MDNDTRRKGDNRPVHHPHRPKRWWPAKGEPFRAFPKHGDPYCWGEVLSQAIVKTIAFAPVYTAIIVTLVLLVAVLGVPFVEGR